MECEIETEVTVASGCVGKDTEHIGHCAADEWVPVGKVAEGVTTPVKRLHRIEKERRAMTHLYTVYFSRMLRPRSGSGWRH